MSENLTPWLTIFTAPKSFEDAHIRMIQRNAIVSWLNLGSAVEIILIGDETGVTDTARELGVKHVPVVERNAQGTPLVSSIFDLAHEASTSQVLAYLNADIIALPDLFESSRIAYSKFEDFLIVGQRWDLELTESISVQPELTAWLQKQIKERGVLHPQGGSDYFIFPRNCFATLPHFAVGRAGWDNWMIYQARLSKMAVINGTGAINIIHQNHDYRHLPQGQPHYRMPETYENVKLAGGKRTIFDLRDTVWQFYKDEIIRKPLSIKRLLRELEIFPLISLKSKWLGQVSYAIFHPVKAYRELRAWLRSKRVIQVQK